MSIESLKERLERLKAAHSGDIIRDWGSYIMWIYLGKSSDAVWDEDFRKEMRELAKTIPK